MIYTHALEQNRVNNKEPHEEVCKFLSDSDNYNHNTEDKTLEIKVEDLPEELESNPQEFLKLCHDYLWPDEKLEGIIQDDDSETPHWDKIDYSGVEDGGVENIVLNYNGDKKMIKDLRVSDENKIRSFEARVENISNTYTVATKYLHTCNNCGSPKTTECDSVVEGLNKPDTECTSCEKYNFDHEPLEHTDKKIMKVTDVEHGNSVAEDIYVHVYPPLLESVMNGDHINITGVVRHIETDDDTTKRERELVALGIEQTNQLENSELEEEDEEWILDFANQDNLDQKLIDSFAPEIVNMDSEKRGILYSIASQNQINGNRGSVHCLYIGDPGTGKSKLMRFANEVVEISSWSSGESATGVGLTGSVEQDKRTNRWIVSAGELVKSNGGIACIDELDKFSEKQLKQSLSALENHLVKIDKASVNTTLECATTVVSGANPKSGTFKDPEEVPIKEQFDLPKEILSRYDVIYTTQDLAGQDDAKIGRAMGSKFMSETEEKGNEDIVDPVLSKSELRKYITYIRDIDTTLSEEARDYGAELWADLRGGDIDIGKRSMESLYRLAIASARLRCKETADKSDIDRAYTITREVIDNIGGKTVRTTGQTQTQHSCREDLLELIRDVYPTIGEEATQENVIQRMSMNQGYDQDIVENRIESELESGRIYELDGILRAS